MYFKIYSTTELTKTTKMSLPRSGNDMLWGKRKSPRSLLLCEGKKKKRLPRGSGNREEGEEYSHELTRMWEETLIFLPCKPFSSPPAEMEKLRGLRALGGKKKVLKRAIDPTQERTREQDKRCREQACVLRFIQPRRCRFRRAETTSCGARENLCVLCFSARERKKVPCGHYSQQGVTRHDRRN